MSILKGLIICNHLCFLLRHAFQSLQAVLPNSELSLANLPASAFGHACHILYSFLGTIGAIKVKSEPLKWPTHPYTVCSFPPHPTFWLYVKLPYFPIPLQSSWSSLWTEKVHHEARTLLLLFPFPGVLSLFPLLSNFLAHSLCSSKWLLLTFINEAFFDPCIKRRLPILSLPISFPHFIVLHDTYHHLKYCT